MPKLSLPHAEQAGDLGHQAEGRDRNPSLLENPAKQAPSLFPFLVHLLCAGVTPGAARWPHGTFVTPLGGEARPPIFQLPHLRLREMSGMPKVTVSVETGLRFRSFRFQNSRSMISA